MVVKKQKLFLKHLLSLVCLLDYKGRCSQSKLVLYKPLVHCNNHLKQLSLSNKVEGFSYKGGCG